MSLSKKIKTAAKKDENWLQNAKERQANKAWLEISFKIAVKILRFLKKEKMTQKELANKLGFSPQYMSKILKGKENLTLETISKIQNIIKIDLIQVPDFSLKKAENCENNDLSLKLNKPDTVLA